MPNSDKALSNQSVRFVTIDSEYTGQRIDNYLITLLKGVPKTHIYRILRKGEVRVNKGRIKPVYRLKEGDIVRIPPLRLSDAKNAPVSLPPALANLKKSIIYEDKDLLVINKPAGIAVHGGSGISLGVIESLRILYPLAKRLELVHRLDRATSGCLLIAKKASVLKKLHEMIRTDRMQKTYVALIKGQMPKKRIEVNAPLRKFVSKSGERVVKVAQDGKIAKSIFFATEVFNKATLVDIKLITGRTHQIRVHSLHLNQPIAGDDKYGDELFNEEIKRFGLSRMFLHARSLRFEHPVTGEIMQPVAPLDDRLQNTLKNLRKKETEGVK